MNISQYGTFDAAFCGGILYHLDRPAEFIRRLSDRVANVIIIHTHIALEDLGPKFPALSPITEHEGLLGRWYSEHDAKSTEEREKYVWSSWTNHRSFWPTKPALLQLVQDSGFDIVFEQFDWLGDDIGAALRGGDYDALQRVMIVGVRNKCLSLTA